jgi:hypothetical protein
MGGTLVTRQPLDSVPAVQAPQTAEARRPLTAPGYHPEWNAFRSKGNRGVGIPRELGGTQIAVMLAGWFGFGFLLGLLFL